jgi:F-type H+-transporting ATPase subunit delta
MASKHDAQLGRIYGKALLELAQEQGVLAQVEADVALLRALLADGSLSQLIDSPVIPAADRQAALGRVLVGKVQPLTERFLSVLSQRNRLADLTAILAGFVAAADDAAGRVDAVATVPAALDAAAARDLAVGLSAAIGRTVSLSVRVDPAILGGLTLQVADQLIDASVAARLRGIRQRLQRAAYEHARTAVTV